MNSNYSATVSIEQSAVNTATVDTKVVSGFLKPWSPTRLSMMQ